MRAWLIAAGLVLSGSLVRADRAAELAKMHLAVVGGTERIAGLSAMRATGTVLMDSGQVNFELIAARPNCVRLETSAGGRTAVQGYDGVQPPWQIEAGSSPPRYRQLPAAAARRIVADAEFDDPLIAGSSRGFAIDYAGEEVREGRKFLRLLVTYRLVETFMLLLNPQTYLIEYRVETRNTVTGRKQEVVTHFDLHLPVNGVLVPHAITTMTDGHVTQMMKIERIDPNPPIPAGTFSRPGAMVPPKP